MKHTKGLEILIYQTKSGEIALKGDLDDHNVWSSQSQIAEIFEIERSVVSRHIKNILNSKELPEKRNMQKMHIANSDKPVTFYSLDLVLAVGYRTNSAKAIHFRRWASSVLTQHLTAGYTVNRSRLGRNYLSFLQAIEQTKKILAVDNNQYDAASALELAKHFASTWLSLDAYDKSQFPTNGTTKKKVRLTTEELAEALAQLKKELIYKKAASELFAAERQAGSLDGIIGNIFQSFDKKDLYPSIEEKVAHLLYFIVKNHPFVDGNKRSGAFAFIWFLQKASRLNCAKITPEALTALTLLIAESNPKNKDQMIGLILLLLQSEHSVTRI